MFRENDFFKNEFLSKFLINGFLWLLDEFDEWKCFFSFEFNRSQHRHWSFADGIPPVVLYKEWYRVYDYRATVPRECTCFFCILILNLFGGRKMTAPLFYFSFRFMIQYSFFYCLLFPFSHEQLGLDLLGYISLFKWLSTTNEKRIAELSTLISEKLIRQ